MSDVDCRHAATSNEEVGIIWTSLTQNEPVGTSHFHAMLAVARYRSWPIAEAGVPEYAAELPPFEDNAEKLKFVFDFDNGKPSRPRHPDARSSDLEASASSTLGY